MTTWLKVVRFHLANPLSYTVLPWGVMAFVFAVWLALPASASGHHAQIQLGGVVVLYLLFVAGMCYGMVYRRWNLIGVLAASAVPVIVLVAGLVITSRAHDWPSVRHFFTALSAAGLTGSLAALTVALLAGGYATMRRHLPIVMSHAVSYMF